MRVPRREFVSTAGFAAGASLFAFPSFGFAAADLRVKAARHTLLDLGTNCALPESFTGMRGALGDSHQILTENGLSSSESSSIKLASTDTRHIIVVPAAGSVPLATLTAVADVLEQGATVLWESGAAFLEPREFTEQQALASQYFDISIQRPIDVWSQATSVKSDSSRKDSAEKSPIARKIRAIGHEQIPYVTYRWPDEAHLRDFSRLIPVSAPVGQAIAHWRDIPVAWMKPAGAGTLIFLGSPLGPALRTGDTEANRLLHSMM